MQGFFLSVWFAEVIIWINSFIGNYGVSIIIFTILAKLLVSPLDLRQRRMSRKIAGLSGKMASIRQRYANDPKKQNEKIQELYRKEGVSVFGSCLPALVAMPIWIALLGAVNLIANEQLIKLVVFDNASPDKLESLLWIRNIWQPDSGLAPVIPDLARWQQINLEATKILSTHELIAQAKAINYESAVKPIVDAFAGFRNGWFILPVLAGAALFFQQKLTMAVTAAPEQQQSNKFLTYGFPIFAIYICATNSAVFSLYWIMSSIIAILLNPIYDRIIDIGEKKQKALAEAGQGGKE